MRPAPSAAGSCSSCPGRAHDRGHGLRAAATGRECDGDGVPRGGRPRRSRGPASRPRRTSRSSTRAACPATAAPTACGRAAALVDHEVGDGCTGLRVAGWREVHDRARPWPSRRSTWLSGGSDRPPCRCRTAVTPLPAAAAADGTARGARARTPSPTRWPARSTTPCSAGSTSGTAGAPPATGRRRRAGGDGRPAGLGRGSGGTAERQALQSACAATVRPRAALRIGATLSRPPDVRNDEDSRLRRPRGRPRPDDAGAHSVLDDCPSSGRRTGLAALDARARGAGARERRAGAIVRDARGEERPPRAGRAASPCRDGAPDAGRPRRPGDRARRVRSCRRTRTAVGWRPPSLASASAPAGRARPLDQRSGSAAVARAAGGAGPADRHRPRERAPVRRAARVRGPPRVAAPHHGRRSPRTWTSAARCPRSRARSPRSQPFDRLACGFVNDVGRLPRDHRAPGGRGLGLGPVLPVVGSGLGLRWS